MKKIYLVKYNNGEDYPEDYQEYTFQYCYSSKEQAIQAIEELQKDQSFLESVNSFYPTFIEFWIDEIELVD